jgi:hypothetical protein
MAFYNVTVKTIRAGSITSIGIYRPSMTSIMVTSCGFCANIGTITLKAEGGIIYSNLTRNGTQFVIDDMCISFGQ